MFLNRKWLAIACAVTLIAGISSGVVADTHKGMKKGEVADFTVDLGPRPLFLIDNMAEDTRAQRKLKEKLASCADMQFESSDFSIGHRGAALQFPEHTKESYLAGARMGAGIVECDVTFTKDKELVCRHSQCDLHTTTNILATPLAEQCTQNFVPAVYDGAGNLVSPASAKCCTSDITLEEFKTLRGKMDGANSTATTVEEYLAGTADFRTDLYAGPSSGTLMTHAESIELFKALGVKMTPELKSPSVAMPYDGDFTQEAYAQKMIDEYKAARVKPRNVFAQSFNRGDIEYWINSEPKFGRQAVYLIPADTPEQLAPFTDELPTYKALGINYVAPAMWALVDSDGADIVPSEYAMTAKANDLKIITWTLERSGVLADGNGGYYYQSLGDVLMDRQNEGVAMELLDVLAQDVGIEGIFSDWPAAVTYYANCMELSKGKRH